MLTSSFGSLTLAQRIWLMVLWCSHNFNSIQISFLNRYTNKSSMTTPWLWCTLLPHGSLTMPQQIWRMVLWSSQNFAGLKYFFNVWLSYNYVTKQNTNYKWTNKSSRTNHVFGSHGNYMVHCQKLGFPIITH